jgi:hypothetical protein
VQIKKKVAPIRKGFLSSTFGLWAEFDEDMKQQTHHFAYWPDPSLQKDPMCAFLEKRPDFRGSRGSNYSTDDSVLSGIGLSLATPQTYGNHTEVTSQSIDCFVLVYSPKHS